MMYIITHKENSEFNEQRNELIGGGVRRGVVFLVLYFRYCVKISCL